MNKINTAFIIFHIFLFAASLILFVYLFFNSYGVIWYLAPASGIAGSLKSIYLILNKKTDFKDYISKIIIYISVYFLLAAIISVLCTLIYVPWLSLIIMIFISRIILSDIYGDEQIAIFLSNPFIYIHIIVIIIACDILLNGIIQL